MCLRRKTLLRAFSMSCLQDIPYRSRGRRIRPAPDSGTHSCIERQTSLHFFFKIWEFLWNSLNSYGKVYNSFKILLISHHKMFFGEVLVLFPWPGLPSHPSPTWQTSVYYSETVQAAPPHKLALTIDTPNRKMQLI